MVEYFPSQMSNLWCKFQQWVDRENVMMKRQVEFIDFFVFLTGNVEIQRENVKVLLFQSSMCTSYSLFTHTLKTQSLSLSLSLSFSLFLHQLFVLFTFWSLTYKILLVEERGVVYLVFHMNCVKLQWKIIFKISLSAKTNHLGTFTFTLKHSLFLNNSFFLWDLNYYSLWDLRSELLLSLLSHKRIEWCDFSLLFSFLFWRRSVAEQLVSMCECNITVVKLSQ
jgi:hypothetical protein